MRTLSPTETKALEKIMCLYNLNGDNEVSKHLVAKIVNDLWMIPVEKSSLIGALISTLNDCLKMAKCRKDFFALVGYDLDMVVSHYQMMAMNEEDEW